MAGKSGLKPKVTDKGIAGKRGIYKPVNVNDVPMDQVAKIGHKVKLVKTTKLVMEDDKEHTAFIIKFEDGYEGVCWPEDFQSVS